MYLHNYMIVWHEIIPMQPLSVFPLDKLPMVWSSTLPTSRLTMTWALWPLTLAMKALGWILPREDLRREPVLTIWMAMLWECSLTCLQDVSVSDSMTNVVYTSYYNFTSTTHHFPCTVPHAHLRTLHMHIDACTRARAHTRTRTHTQLSTSFESMALWLETPSWPFPSMFKTSQL